MRYSDAVDELKSSMSSGRSNFKLCQNRGDRAGELIGGSLRADGVG
jgi:hypothetical protein